MKELYLLHSIIQKPEVLNEIYFLDKIHFNKYGEHFEFIKQRYSDIGEISLIDLALKDLRLPSPEVTYDALGIPEQQYTLDENKIIELSRHLFDEYQKYRILKELKTIKDGNIDDIVDKMKELVESVDDEYQKNKLEDKIIDLIDPLFAKVDKLRKSNESNGLTLQTLPTMNKIIGGIMPTDLIGIYGKEKSAKSTLALEMMLDLCVDQKVGGIIFSFEMDNDLMVMKSLSMRLGVNINEFRNPNYSELDENQFMQLALEAGKRFHNTNLFLIDQILDEYEIEAKIKKLLDKGIKIVLIDYLMLVSSRNKFNNTRDELNYLSKFFKRIAQKYKIVIILISQSNEAGERAAEAKGLERDSNYYFYVMKIEANEQIKINGKEYRAGDEPEYIVKNRGIRHAKGGDYFIIKFVNNKIQEITDKYEYNF